MVTAKRSKILLALVPVLVAVLIVGCGSSSSDPLTRAEFLKRGNEICAQSTTQRRDKAKNFETDATGAAGMAQLVDTTLIPLKKMAGELGSLEAPPLQMKAVKVYVTKLDHGIAKVEAKPIEAISGAPFEGANGAARSAGLPACTV
jgi:hypothetical protein